MISYFDVYMTNVMEDINVQLKELDISTLDVVNIETMTSKTRVWYRKYEKMTEAQISELAKEIVELIVAKRFKDKG